jgi:hypothetical protein
MMKSSAIAVIAASALIPLFVGTPSASATTEEDEAFLQYFMHLGGQLSGNDNAEEVIRIGKYFCNVLRSGGTQRDAYVPLYSAYPADDDVRNTIGRATAAAVMIYCPDQLDSP